MDRALANAMAKRDALAAEINKHLQEVEDMKRSLAAVDRFIEQWYEYAGTEPSVDSGAAEAGSTPTLRRGRVTGNPSRDVVADTARAAILDAGSPLSRSDLYKALEERGVVVKGADPLKTLSTMLWRSAEKIARVKGGGYWPADIPNPSVDYDPSASLSDTVANTPVEEVDPPTEGEAPSIADFVR